MGSLLARRIDEYIETNTEARTEERTEARVKARVEAAEARTEARVRSALLERERAMLSRLAERRFGAGAGARLAELLAEVADPERLAAVGDLVIDCADGAELLARAREEANRR